MTRSVLVGSIAVAIGCGGNPITPSGTARPVGLAISGAEALLTDSTESYTLTATLPDGSRQSITATWISSSAGIATVNAGGQLTGRSHGSTTLTASYAGGSATLLVHVVNNYAGTWSGQDIIRTCTDSGDLTDHDGGWCAGGAGRIGTARPMKVVLEQTGNTLSEISGTIGNVPGTVLTGVVTPEGSLNLRGSWNVLDWDGDVVAVDGIRDWDTNLTAPGVMAGRWSEDYKSVLFRIGSASMASDITMSRSSPWDYVVRR